MSLRDNNKRMELTLYSNLCRTLDTFIALIGQCYCVSSCIWHFSILNSQRVHIVFLGHDKFAAVKYSFIILYPFGLGFLWVYLTVKNNLLSFTCLGVLKGCDNSEFFCSELKNKSKSWFYTVLQNWINVYWIQNPHQGRSNRRKLLLHQWELQKDPHHWAHNSSLQGLVFCHQKLFHTCHLFEVLCHPWATWVHKSLWTQSTQTQLFHLQPPPGFEVWRWTQQQVLKQRKCSRFRSIASYTQ